MLWTGHVALRVIRENVTPTESVIHGAKFGVKIKGEYFLLLETQGPDLRYLRRTS